MRRTAAGLGVRMLKPATSQSAHDAWGAIPTVSPVARGKRSAAVPAGARGKLLVEGAPPRLDRRTVEVNSPQRQSSARS